MAGKAVLLIANDRAIVDSCNVALDKVTQVFYKLFSARTLQQGIHTAANSPVDCIIFAATDDQQQNEYGIRKLKELFGHLPLIVITYESGNTSEQRLLNAGAHECINAFSLTSEKLHHTITRALKTEDRFYQPQKRMHSSHRILIIDDNLDDIELCSRRLEAATNRYEVFSAISGKDGLEKINLVNPDCILLDYSMPGLSGLEILTKILNSHLFIPIIIMTGQGNEKIAVDAFKRGAENYVVKNELDTDMLDKHIQQAISKKALELELLKKENALFKKQIELAEVLQFQDLILNSLPELVYVKNQAGRVLKSNLEHKRGIAQAIPHMRNISEGVEDNALTEDEIHAFKDGIWESVRVKQVGDNSRTLWSRFKRFENHDGQLFILCVVIDITERERFTALAD